MACFTGRLERPDWRQLVTREQPSLGCWLMHISFDISDATAVHQTMLPRGRPPRLLEGDLIEQTPTKSHHLGAYAAHFRMAKNSMQRSSEYPAKGVPGLQVRTNLEVQYIHNIPPICPGVWSPDSTREDGSNLEAPKHEPPRTRAIAILSKRRFRLNMGTQRGRVGSGSGFPFWLPHTGGYRHSQDKVYDAVEVLRGQRVKHRLASDCCVRASPD